MRPMVVFPQGKGTERKDRSNRGGLSKARSSTALLRLLEGQGLMVKPDWESGETLVKHSLQSGGGAHL